MTRRAIDLVRIVTAAALLSNAVSYDAQTLLNELETQSVNVPRLISLSGSLQDRGGRPLSGVVALSFALYTDQQGGPPLWLENQNLNLDERGNYTVMLGAYSKGGLPMDLFTRAETRWLGVQANLPGEAEQPRLMLVSVPYALKAGDADTLGGKPASAFLPAPEVVADKSGTEPVISNASGTGSNNQIAKWVDDTGALGNSIAKDNGTFIEIAGASELLRLTGIGNTAMTLASSGTDRESRSLLLDQYRKFHIYNVTDGTSELVIDNNHQVGIGTDQPSAPLHVFSSSASFGMIEGSSPDPSGSVKIGLLIRNNTPSGRQWSLRSSGGGRLIVRDDTSATDRFTLTSDGSAVLEANLRLDGSITSPLGGLTVQLNPTSPNIIKGSRYNFLTSGSIVGATIGGGGVVTRGNSVSGDYGVVAGGSRNTAARYATVGGGEGNGAFAEASTIAGGEVNQTEGVGTTIGGGVGNRARGRSATIGGGDDNRILNSTDNYATVSGGLLNSAGAAYVAVGGGLQNAGSGLYSTVSGGHENSATGESSTVSGGYRNVASGLYATIGGGFGNSVTGLKGTVGGGGRANDAISDTANRVTGNWGTVSGGGANLAGGGSYSTVSGGGVNTASGQFSTVPGGTNNIASGALSFASGQGANAAHDGAWVWGDSSAGAVTSSAANQFTARASGGVQFFSNASLTAGVSLAPGAGSWSSVSDRNMKENLSLMAGGVLLEKLRRVPIQTWNYKAQDRSIRHIGPMAQDFRAAFGLGEDDAHISTIDADGVALAGVQALYELLTKKEQEIRAQRDLIRQLNERLLRLETLQQERN